MQNVRAQAVESFNGHTTLVSILNATHDRLMFSVSLRGLNTANCYCLIDSKLQALSELSMELHDVECEDSNSQNIRALSLHCSLRCVVAIIKCGFPCFLAATFEKYVSSLLPRLRHHS